MTCILVSPVYTKGYMNKSINGTRAIVVAVVAGGAVFFAWAWQGMSATLQKGIADGSSIRISMRNSCVTSEESVGTPHFSGCNSIL